LAQQHLGTMADGADILFRDRGPGIYAPVSVQSNAESPVLNSQTCLVSAYRITEGMKDWIDLAQSEDQTPDLCLGSAKSYRYATGLQL
jgi:hypothetical protein